MKHEAQVLRRCRNKKVSRAEERSYRLPEPVPTPAVPPVVVGAGPGGLFCALALARCGARPILLERGWNVERRQADVERFWSTGTLDTESNVQFGEGAPGPSPTEAEHRHPGPPPPLHPGDPGVHGAPESILMDAKPHVGTDYLHRTLISLRRGAGGPGLRYPLRPQADGAGGSGGACDRPGGGGARRALPPPRPAGGPGPGQQRPGHLPDAPRHRGAHGAQALAVGVRIEHRQRDIDLTQYKELAGHPRLGAASYKLSCHLDSGRGVFSFCVCPGGQVVAAASEAERTVTNGMSLYAREGENCNGGLLVSVTPEDFPGQGPLAGIAFQRELEARAFAAGGGGYTAPPSGWRTSWPDGPRQDRAGSGPPTAPASAGATCGRCCQSYLPVSGGGPAPAG